MTQLRGIVASLLTPFDSGQNLDLGASRRLVRFLLRSGIHGFYLIGSAGEWVHLTVEERKQIVEVAMEEVAGRVPVVVHVGHHTTAAAIELCTHARDLGADFVSSVVPGYYPYSRCEICAYYKALAEVGVPVIAYYLNGLGHELEPEAFVDTVGNVPGVVGLKYTGANLFAMQRVLQLSGGRLRSWGGHDQMALAALIMEAEGLIGTNYNYVPELYFELYEAFIRGDLGSAKELQAEANNIIAAVKRYGNLRAYKAILELRGLPVGTCRPPLSTLTYDETIGLRQVFLDRRSAVHPH